MLLGSGRGTMQSVQGKPENAFGSTFSSTKAVIHAIKGVNLGGLSMMIRTRLLAPLVLGSLLLGCGGSTKQAESADSPATKGESPSNSAAGDVESGGKPETNKSVAPEVTTGLQALEKRAASLDFDLNLSKKGTGSGVQSGQWSFAEERTLRVKKAKDNKVLELEVVYGKWEAKPLLGMTYEVPTDGKTYLVSFVDNLSIMRGSEKASPAEEKAVASEYGWVGNPSALRKALLDAKLVPETHIAMSPQVNAALLGAIPGVDVAHAGIMASIKGVKTQGRQVATLDVAGSFSIKSKKATFDIEVKGPAEVDMPTGWVQSMDLKGTVTVSGQTDVGKKGTMDVEGKGKFTLTRQLDFK